MNEKKQNAWNFSSVFFFFLLIALTGFLLDRKEVDIRDMKFRDAVVIVLATYRMTRVIVFEKIFKYFRDVVRRRRDFYLIGTLCSIITCPWCAGVWVTLIIIIFYYLVPYGTILTYVLALAGVSSLVILFSNLIHMWADTKQRIHKLNKNGDLS